MPGGPWACAWSGVIENVAAMPAEARRACSSGPARDDAHAAASRRQDRCARAPCGLDGPALRPTRRDGGSEEGGDGAAPTGRRVVAGGAGSRRGEVRAAHLGKALGDVLRPVRHTLYQDSLCGLARLGSGGQPFDPTLSASATHHRRRKFQCPTGWPSSVQSCLDSPPSSPRSPVSADSG